MPRRGAEHRRALRPGLRFLDLDLSQPKAQLGMDLHAVSP
jgi:hypothetical protein